MAYSSENPSKLDEKIMMQVEQARSGRQHFQTAYNNFLDLAAPWRPRVGEKATQDNPRAPSEQDSIFDTTLQDAVDDWASDCADEFTPSYRPWTTYEPIGGASRFSQPAQKKIQEYVVNHMKVIYDAINQSGFEEQSQGCYVDLAIGPTGIDIPYTPAGQPLRFEHVPISELLILPSPFGGPGDRFRERQIPVKHLDLIWPDADFSRQGSESQRKNNNATVTVIQAYLRDWDNRSEEVWKNYLLVEGAIARGEQVDKGDGSCRLIAARPRVSAPSAYGIGYGNKAVPPARVLDEMAYLSLKRTGRSIDPPTIYWDDGTLNPDGGFDTGEWAEAGENFEVKEMYPQGDAREAWFAQEDLRMQVKRALFQDKPYQRGDTPPTATQWMDERQTNARRKAFPRAAITREFVLPVLRRVGWILRKRKVLEDIDIEGELVRLQPISPMSRASDLEEVQMADQHMQMFGARFPDSAPKYYDIPKMMEKVRDKLGGDVIEIRDEDTVRQMDQEAAENEARARGNLEGQQV